MRERCEPEKVGLAARVDLLLREHAHATMSPAVEAVEAVEVPSTEEALELARTLAAIRFGDASEPVAPMKAANPAS